MKKIFISFLCGIAFITPSVLALNFSDVSPSDWFFESVNNLADWGVVKGNEDGSFGPTRGANRAEIAVMFNRYDKRLEDKFYKREDVDRIIDELRKTGFDTEREGAEGTYDDPDDEKTRETDYDLDRDGSLDIIDFYYGTDGDDDTSDPTKDVNPPVAVIIAPDLVHLGAFFDEDPRSALEVAPPTIMLANGIDRSAEYFTPSLQPVGTAADVEIDEQWKAIEIYFDDTNVGTAYYLPEIDDEVIVGLQAGDLRGDTERFAKAGESFVLDGSKSQDDGVIQTFLWTQTGGPIIFDEKRGEILTVTPQTPGTYEFELTVVDNTGLSSSSAPPGTHVAPSQVKVLVMP